MTVYHPYTPQFVYGIPVTRFLFLQSGVGLKFLSITLIFSGRSVQIQMSQNRDSEVDRYVDFHCDGRTDYLHIIADTTKMLSLSFVI